MTATPRRALPTALWLAVLAAAPAAAADRVEATIDWPQAQADIRAADGPGAASGDRATVAQLRSAPALQQTLDRIALPVLVPDQGTVRAAPSLIEQGRAYAADYPLDGADLVVLGASSAIAVAEDAPVAALLAGDAPQYVFESYEYGADLSFLRYGASYVLRLACDELDDARCRKDDFLRKVADGLVAVGGRAR